MNTKKISDPASDAGLIIRRAAPKEYQDIRAFYHALIDAAKGNPRYFKWKKDIYPAPDALKAAIDAQTFHAGLADGRIAAGMVVNRKCNEEYWDVAWPEKLSQDEFYVIHMLGVHSDFAGRGYGKAMVRHAIDLARKDGMKAVRLDVLKDNLPAHRLYEGIGFVYADSLQLYYENTGRADFDFYEYLIL